MRDKILENGLLDRLTFRGRFDDQIALAQIGQSRRRLDPREGGLLILFGDFPAAHLPFHVAFDGVHRG